MSDIPSRALSSFVRYSGEEKMAKKNSVPKNHYAFYQRRGETGQAPKPEQWWRNNGLHYTLVATIEATSLEEAHLLTRHQGSVWYLAPGVTVLASVPIRASRDGDVLLLSEIQEPRYQQTWMILSGRPTLIAPPEEEPFQSIRQQRAVFAVAWSPDSRFFAVGGGQGLVRVHLLESVRESSYDSHAAYVQSLAWSPDGKRIATGDDRNATHIWDVAHSEAHVFPSGRILICQEQRETGQWYKGVYAVAWSPDGKLVAAGSYQGHIFLWHAETGACFSRFEARQEAVRALAFSLGGTHLASVGDDAQMQIWDIRSQRCCVTCSIPSLGELHALAWSPDGMALLVGGMQQSMLFLYDTGGTRKGEILLSRFTQRVGVYCVAYAPNDDYAVAGCADGTVQIVDTLTGEHLHTYHGHQAPVRAVAWSPDGKHILSGSEDAHAFVWTVPPELARAIRAPLLPGLGGEDARA